ncbi:hypothetical protein RP20_CCG002439 [Aedes albopictus]|nr:hypothetical protein RP20_CCG002439 [Aedes albopictus]
MSSSESEDENIKRFLEAADTTLINDAMFQGISAKTQSEPEQDNIVQIASECPKSNRYLVDEENVFQSDINVTESMKKFVGKKLSSIIEKNIDFVDIKGGKLHKHRNKSADSSGVKLLRDCDSYLKTVDAVVDVAPPPGNKHRKSIKKRMVEPDVSSEKEKLSQVVIEPGSIAALSKCWTNRPKTVVYEYKTVGSIKLLQEPSNEFTKAKRKNQWDESKIAKYGKKLKER